ncbi:MAG: diaminopimelate decarboxylase [Ignavibacteriaceae bacterium]|nr:diaminopimelate decarboxylase [Ignavibacteriaceae bacterium]
MTPDSYGDFHYRGKKLFCGDVCIEDIAHQFGTPVYIYSAGHFRDQYSAFTKAFKKIPHRIFYAVKSNANLSVIREFHQLGAGMDVNSEGEMLRAMKAGVKGNEMILTGVGKSAAEIRAGLEQGVTMIKAESKDELALIDRIAGEMGLTAPVAIRVNPDVNPRTHPYISTGLSENKFGISKPLALNIYKNYQEFPNIRFTGIDMHIGSQITATAPFKEAVDKLAEVYFEVKRGGLHLEHFDIGGGIGIRYEDETPFTPDGLASVISPTLKELDCDIFFEPGRYLTGNGGILVVKVLYIKEAEDKHFIVTDGAMNDLLRPSIYDAYHHVQPLTLRDQPEVVTDVVGPVCESGDFFTRKRALQTPEHNELLAVMSAGAYGMVMSSNYNARRRVPEVMVDGNKFRLIRSRETYDHLLYDEADLLNGNSI